MDMPYKVAPLQILLERNLKNLNKSGKMYSQFGPQTLMEGWIPLLNDEKIQEDIVDLINSFIEIVSLIDETLLEFQKKTKN